MPKQSCVHGPNAMQGAPKLVAVAGRHVDLTVQAAGDPELERHRWPMGKGEASQNLCLASSSCSPCADQAWAQCGGASHLRVHEGSPPHPQNYGPASLAEMQRRYKFSDVA